jgi:hypothetical protein
MSRRRRLLSSCASLFLLLGLLAVPACGDDARAPRTSPPSAAERQTLCHEWADVGCRKNIECASVSGTLAECVARDEASCLQEIQGQSAGCQAAHADAIERCDDELEGESCSQYCNPDGFCFQSCLYFCS